MKKTVDIIVIGRVQGVGFRYATIRLADSLEVDGYVENLPDGSVHIVASANDNQLNQFIDSVKASPTPYGKVTSTKIHYTTSNVNKGFDVKY